MEEWLDVNKTYVKNGFETRNKKLVAVTRRDARSLRGQLPTECLFRWGLRLHWIPRRTHTAPCRPLWLLTNAIRLHFSSGGPFQ